MIVDEIMIRDALFASHGLLVYYNIYDSDIEYVCAVR